MSKIYYMRDSGSERAFRAKLEGVTRKEAWALLTCEIERSMLYARWTMGSSSPGDVVWTTLVYPMLVSERIFQRFMERGFRGWHAIPVEMRGKANEILPPYYFVCVSGRCGPVQEKPKLSSDASVDQRVLSSETIYFDPATWDGSDIFMSDGKGYKFVLEAVKDALIEANENVLFRHLDDIELPPLT